MPFIDAEIEIGFEVYCDTCNAGLCNVTSCEGTTVRVEACEACVRRAEQTARSEGWDEGYEEGFSKGRYEAGIEDEE